MDSNGSDTESQDSAAPGWFSLPAEIRLMILGCVPKGSWTACATVCKDWQAFIEPRNFQNLHLQVQCLNDFEAIMSPRIRPMVRAVWLNMELRPYGCDSCAELVSNSWTRNDRELMRKAISRLYAILAAWKPEETVPGGIELELSAQSPSDREHWFKECHFYPYDEFTRGKPASDAESRPYDGHGWKDGQRIFSPHIQALGRVHGEIHLDFQNKPLPSVACVRRFGVRRHCRRRFSTSTMYQLFKKLTGLKEFVYQPWLAEHDGQRIVALLANFYDVDGTAALLKGLPKGVETIELFEHAHESFDLNSMVLSPAVMSTLVESWEKFREQPVLHTSMALARRSRRLKSVSVAFMTEACYFFRSCEPDWQWKKLRSLTLTSKVLAAGVGSVWVSKLLQEAGETALRMPKLQDMTIWNGSEGNACAFTYHRDSKADRCEVAWRGTWDTEFEPSMIETWHKVASQVVPRGGLRVTKHPRILGTVRGRGEAISLLELPEHVVGSFPLWCMRNELASNRLAE